MWNPGRVQRGGGSGAAGGRAGVAFELADPVVGGGAQKLSSVRGGLRTEEHHGQLVRHLPAEKTGGATPDQAGQGKPLWLQTLVCTPREIRQDAIDASRCKCRGGAIGCSVLFTAAASATKTWSRAMEWPACSADTPCLRCARSSWFRHQPTSPAASIPVDPTKQLGLRNLSP